MSINDNERKTKETTDKISTCEFDVETGTYLEDVHSNDFIGDDLDGDGLNDDVEKLIEEYQDRADAYNDEQDRIRQERIEKEEQETVDKANSNKSFCLSI